MYTRLTAQASHGPERCCTQWASSALPWGSSTTLPSMPAVSRPALTSVTRRTLTSVFAQERSINFCKLRTRLRSPACDAVKIRCRKRRTSSSTLRQSTAYQSGKSSSGPFTITARSPTEVGSCIVMVSNLSFGSGVVVVSSAQAHLARVSTLSGRASALSGQLSKTTDEGVGHRVLVSCGLSAYRRSLLGSSQSRRRVGPSSRLAYRPRHRAGPRRGYHVPHLRATTGVGASYIPGTAVLTRPTNGPRPAPAASQRPVPTPRWNIPSSGASDNETSTEVQAIHPSDLPLACGARMERAPWGFYPELRTPPLPAAHVRVGTGLKHWPGTTLTT
jgi:hypothetical protein